MMVTKVLQMSLASAFLFGGAASAQVWGERWDQDRFDRERLTERERFTDHDRFMTRDRMRDISMERATELKDRRIEGRDGDRIGRVENIAIDLDKGKAVYFIVTTEAMEDARDRRKIVPVEAIESRGEDRPLRLTVSKDRLRQAPSFDEIGWRNLSDRRLQSAIYQHYGVSPAMHQDGGWDRHPMDRFDDRFDRGWQQDRRLTTRDWDRGVGAQIGDRLTLVRVSELIDYPLNNPQGQRLGTIKDIVLDVDRGHLTYVALRPAEGVREREQRIVLAPWAKVSYHPHERTLVMDIERQRLREAPSFAQGRWPDVTSPQVADRVLAFYDVQDDFIMGYTPPRETGAVGWEAGSEYNRRFDPGRIESYRGEIVAIERFTPMSGMGDGVQLRIRTQEDETKAVHLGPMWFFENQPLRLSEGDEVRIRGARTEIHGREAIIATQVQRGNNILLLRDPSGTPRWSTWIREDDLRRIEQRWRERARERNGD